MNSYVCLQKKLKKSNTKVKSYIYNFPIALADPYYSIRNEPHGIPYLFPGKFSSYHAMFLCTIKSESVNTRILSTYTDVPKLLPEDQQAGISGARALCRTNVKQLFRTP